MKTDRWTAAYLSLAVVGLVDSAYLTLNSLFSQVPLECPSSGIINCGLVTTSVYSHIFGIPVAALGLGWFAVILFLGFVEPSFSVYAMLPFWIAGTITIGYLAYAEVFLIHAICLYCTLAHICAILLIAPIAKKTLSTG